MFDDIVGYSVINHKARLMPLDYTKPAAELLVSLINETNSSAIPLDDLSFGVPTVNADPGGLTPKNTFVVASGKELTDYEGDVTLNYDRINFALLALGRDTEFQMSAENTVAELLTQLNTRWGINLTAEDITNTAFPAFEEGTPSFVQQIEAAPASLIFYGTMNVTLLAPSAGPTDLNGLIETTELNGLDFTPLNSTISLSEFFTMTELDGLQFLPALPAGEFYIDPQVIATYDDNGEVVPSGAGFEGLGRMDANISSLGNGFSHVESSNYAIEITPDVYFFLNVSDTQSPRAWLSSASVLQTDAVSGEAGALASGDTAAFQSWLNSQYPLTAEIYDNSGNLSFFFDFRADALINAEGTVRYGVYTEAGMGSVWDTTSADALFRLKMTKTPQMQDVVSSPGLGGFFEHIPA